VIKQFGIVKGIFRCRITQIPTNLAAVVRARTPTSVHFAVMATEITALLKGKLSMVLNKRCIQ
jgi:hypothetical protein